MTISKQEVFLILRAQTGDRAAFDELLKSNQTAIFRYIYRIIGDYALAEDILQEVFLIVYRKIRWLENPQLFRAWIYRIASREAFRHLKKEKNRAEQICDDALLENFPVEEACEIYEPELLEKLPELISKVSPASRAVLVLHYLEDLSLSEIAEILDISVGTVKSRLAYGLANLREKIKKEQ